MLRGRVAIVAATSVLTLGLCPGTADAANVAAAVPGSVVAGYATPVIVLAKAGPATFVNGDAVAPHDVRSVARGPSGRPWFSTPVIGVGQAAISIDQGTPAGQYEFFCTVHPDTMRGTAIVQ